MPHARGTGRAHGVESVPPGHVLVVDGRGDPGDIMVGDDEGVVVVPRHLADEVARDAAEQEKLEAFIRERVENGANLPGTYPPNAQTRAAYEAWHKEKGI